MTDAKMLWFDFGGDIGVGSNMDLLQDDGLYTATLISLFTDRRAPLEAELPQDETSRRGWWNDALGGQKIGSLLWLINREKTLPEVAARAEEYCREALAWMIEQGIAAKVDIEAQIIKPIGLQLEIRITRGSSKQYAYLWEGVKNSAQLEAGNTSIKLQFI